MYHHGQEQTQGNYSETLGSVADVIALGPSLWRGPGRLTNREERSGSTLLSGRY